MAVTRARISMPSWGRSKAPESPADESESPTKTPGSDAAAEGDGATDARRESPVQVEALRPRAPRGRAPRPRGELAPDPVSDSSQPRPLRVLLIEDVDDVAAHLRESLRANPTVRVIGTVRDGRRAVEEVRDLRPDIVIVDALLKGRTKGVDLGRRFREAGLAVGVVAVTVPDRPIADPARHGIDVVVNLPITTFDLARAIGGAATALRERDPARSSRVVAVFGPKGGVGRTTIAFNLATCLAELGLRTALVDGSLQYGDVRRLLRVSPLEPSVCDLPTDCVRSSDLTDNVLRDPSGVDVLLAPPRPEMAELITPRDLEAIIDLLRRSYQAVVVDTPPALAESTLVMLDAADTILTIVSPETGAIDAARTALEAFTAMGYSEAKVQVVVNRADTRGGLTRAQITRAIGRGPDSELPSDWQLVSGANAEGVPFVRERPDAPVSVAVRQLAASVAAVVGAQSAPVPVRTRRRRAS